MSVFRDGDLVHFSLDVPDLEKARAFYSQLLGWNVGPDTRWQIDNLKLGGGLSEGTEPLTFYFWSDDVAATVEKVLALGGSSDGAESGRSGDWAMCRDNQGTRFSLSRLIPEFQPETREPRAQPGELGYWVIPMADVAKGRDFYGPLFGWQFAPGDQYAHITNTSTPGGLANMEGDSPKGWYRVSEIRGALALVTELGGRAGEASASESGWSASCHDDQGVPLELWQPAPGQ